MPDQQTEQQTDQQTDQQTAEQAKANPEPTPDPGPATTTPEPDPDPDPDPARPEDWLQAMYDQVCRDRGLDPLPPPAPAPAAPTMPMPPPPPTTPGAAARMPVPAGTPDRPTIYLLNEASPGLLADGDLLAIAEACDTQIRRDLAPAWGMTALPVRAVPRGAPLPPGGFNILVTDTLDDQNAAGWHTDDASGIHGQVAVKAWLDHGGTVRYGPNSVATTCSHEVAELFCDRSANAWRDTGAGWEMVQEVCDPVEGDAYTITTSAGPVSVSNVLYPGYFDPYAPLGARLDLMGKLTRPFTADQGGYFVFRRAGGQPQQHFADAVPGWKRELKQHEATRTGRIMGYPASVSNP